MDNFGQNYCTCFSGYSGSTCLFQTSACGSNSTVCKNGGTCVTTTNNVEGYVCSCAAGFIGADCGSNKLEYSVLVYCKNHWLLSSQQK